MPQRLAWTRRGWEDYIFWQEHDKKMCKKINKLIKDIFRHPFQGEGKPEPLSYQFSGSWSRRIDSEHRLVYSFDEQTSTVTVSQCRFHYQE